MLTIIVPIFNMERYIHSCIESLINQTYQDIEIILVDDGSTDNSGVFCDEIARKYEKVHVHHKRNGGLISAWRAGVILSKGEYIGFVDPDDYLESDYYERLMMPIIKYDCEISMCGFSMEGEVCEKISPLKLLSSGVYANETLERIKNDYFHYQIQNSRCLKVIKKKLIMNNLKYVDESVVLGEDMTISVPCILDSKSIYVYQDYFGYHYRIYTLSMSHSLKKGQIENFYTLYNIVKREFTEKGYRLDTVKEEFVRQLISVIGLVILSDETNREKKNQLIELRNHKDIKEILLPNPKLRLSWKILYLLFKRKFYDGLIALGLYKIMVNKGCK